MHIEVDQSGKIEQLNKDTVIAFSNKNQYSFLLDYLRKDYSAIDPKIIRFGRIGKSSNTGYHTVCISNISYYISNYCGLMPEEVVKIKSRILEIKKKLGGWK